MPQSIDKNWAWFVLFGACLANFLAGGIMFSFGILFTDLLDRLEPPVLHAAAIGAIAFAVWCFIAPFSAAMTGKLGYRFVTVFGGAVGFLGMLLGCFAPTIHFFYVFFGILVGCGFGLVAMASLAAVEDYFEKRNDISFAILSCGLPAGIFILPLITRALFETYSYFGTYLILSALMLNVIVCGLLFKPLVKNVLVERDKGTYKQMINPVENEQEKSMESSLAGKPADSKSEKDMKKESDADEADNEETKKLRSPKSPRELKYKSIEMPEETKIVPLTSATLRFDDFTVDDEMADEDGYDEESPVDKEVESPIKETESRVDYTGEPDVTHDSKTFSQPDMPVKETKESGKALLYIIIGVDDAGILCNGQIILYLLASIMFAIGFGVPLVFYPDVARNYGYSDTYAEWTLSLLGLGACVGVVLSNFISLLLSRKMETGALLVASMSCVVAGILVGLVHYFTGYRILILTSFLFGIFGVVLLFLRQRIVEEILNGKYHNSGYLFGFWLSGFGYIIGIPIAGWLKDHFDTYMWSFALAGISLGVCALLLSPLICLKKVKTS